MKRNCRGKKVSDSTWEDSIEIKGGNRKKKNYFFFRTA